jgi:hypothetical protein
MARSSGALPWPSSPSLGEAGATARCDDADVRAMTVVPGQKGTAGIGEVPDPDMQDGALLVRGMAVGICGADREIAEGACGTPPPGEASLIIGHEGLGEVLEGPAGSGFAPGDLRFGERGIVRRHGYGSERWRVEPDFAVPLMPRLGELGVLLEPASELAKAWDQVDQISRRAFFQRGRALVTGAGPKRDLVEDLGPALDVDATALNRNMVLRNQVLFGSVNAGRRHWEQAAEALAAADPAWLGALSIRRVPLTSWTDALDRQPEDVKVVMDLTA